MLVVSGKKNSTWTTWFKHESGHAVVSIIANTIRHESAKAQEVSGE